LNSEVAGIHVKALAMPLVKMTVTILAILHARGIAGKKLSKEK
jgi:hypothetical protein